MIRLNMIVEGQTEEEFVHSVLKEPLGQLRVFVGVRRVETSRDKRRGRVFRGGLLDYERARRDLLRWMREDQRPEAHFTTMFDLYGLPDNFPEYGGAKNLNDPYRRVATLEKAFGAGINHPRFIPYVQLHEFEALLLSNPAKFDWEFIDHGDSIDRLITMAASFASPELIDDGEDTAPSKRIIQEIPEYQGRKASAGPLIASKIGLATLRQKCPHFNEWLNRLEQLGKEGPSEESNR